ncbi:DUF559 domain-containing protein [Nonomuraea salmonea]|uniref:DUF559 domain-containing protein n=1 Tax=Nonomuraea salmonea TaxID=46181 RepID=UPI003CD0BC42
MERTALDCARWLPRTEAVAILDRFARRGVDLEALWHRPLNSWRLRDTLSLADRGAASPRESWLRVILVDGGLPRPTTQIKVQLSEDRSAYLDLGWEEYKVAVEYDGREHHTSPADQQHDTDRREELRRRGWRVIAVRRDVIPAQIADLLHQVANTLIEQGWQPGPPKERPASSPESAPPAANPATADPAPPTDGSHSRRPPVHSSASRRSVHGGSLACGSSTHRPHTCESSPVGRPRSGGPPGGRLRVDRPRVGRPRVGRPRAGGHLRVVRRQVVEPQVACSWAPCPVFWLQG